MRQKTKDSFMTDFSWTYSCNTTRHGLSAQATIMLETKLIQLVINRMFLEEHLYQASFPQV